MASSTTPLDIVDSGPYISAFHNTLDIVCHEGLKIWNYPLDNFLSCLVITTQELKRAPLWRYIYIIFGIPFWLTWSLITIPFGIMFMLLYMTVAKHRKPYRYSYVRNEPAPSENSKRTYAIVSSNVCIMHESLTRFNNQHNTFQKAEDIGKTLVYQQLGMRTEYKALSQKGMIESEIYKLRDEKLTSIGAHDAVKSKEQNGNTTKGDFYTKVHPVQNGFTNNLTNRKASKQTNGTTLGGEVNGDNNNENDVQHNNEKNGNSHFNYSILQEFPDIDILCLQETWELKQTKELVKELHKVFPYIIYDARVDGVLSNMFLMNSGLLIASRYPILEVDFDYFRCSRSQCKLASKGLLQAKVSLGSTAEGRPVVGYVYNTHLQAYQGTYPVQQRQMDDILKWTEDFRCRKHAHNEVVAFDVLTGDFNADNMSKVDCGTQVHPLFGVYADVCRVKPGLDHRWTVGTEMRHTPLHDDLIQTPLGLKLALEDPYLLQHYVLSADIDDAVFEIAFDMPARDQDGRLILSEVGGNRRIDITLFRRGDGVKVLGCNPVTQLASLTDHIPYCLTFEVSL